MELPLQPMMLLLLPKKLLDYAGIGKDLILFAYADKIEIWSKKAYEAMMNSEGDFASLAEEVMGNKEVQNKND